MGPELEVLDFRRGRRLLSALGRLWNPWLFSNGGGGGVELIFQELKRRDLKPNQSPLSNAEVKNEWTYTSIASMGCISSGPTS